MMMMVMVMVVRGGRRRRAGRGRLMVTQVVPARRQVQVEAGGCRVLAAARFGAGCVAAVARLLVGRQAHRRLRRVHGPRADERALHPAQLHAPFEVPIQVRLGPGRQRPLELGYFRLRLTTFLILPRAKS